MPINEAFIKRLAARKQKILERLDADHGKALDRALISLERRVVNDAMEIPKWTTRAAIEFKPSIEQAVRENYLDWARQTVDGYDKSAGEILAMYGKLDLPPELTTIDREVIAQLKQMHFEGFQDIALTTIKDLSDSVYQSALTGENPAIAIDRLRGTINGIYHEADTAEVQRLVDFVKENRDNPRMEEAVASAVDELHSIHGATATGQNMRRYANQMVHDSLMQFDSQFTKHMAEQAGLDHYYYAGTSVRDSRPWCISHIGRVMSEDEIRDEWANNTWGGKSSGDPFTVRGGYNCRHQWMPVDPDWIDEPVEEEPLWAVEENVDLARGFNKRMQLSDKNDIVWLEPEKVIAATVPSQRLSSVNSKGLIKKRLAATTERLKSGEPMNPPEIGLTDTGQIMFDDGRHRTLASKLLKYKKIPFVVSKAEKRRILKQT